MLPKIDSDAPPPEKRKPCQMNDGTCLEESHYPEGWRYTPGMHEKPPTECTCDPYIGFHTDIGNCKKPHSPLADMVDALIPDTKTANSKPDDIISATVTEVSYDGENWTPGCGDGQCGQALFGTPPYKRVRRIK